MLAHIVHDLQPEVRQRAAGERDPIAHDAREQLMVVLDMNAVVDALGMQQIKCIANIRRRPLFAGMRHAMPAKSPRPRELLDEACRGIVHFRRIQTDAEDLVFPRLRQIEDHVR